MLKVVKLAVRPLYFIRAFRFSDEHEIKLHEAFWALRVSDLVIVHDGKAGGR
jgi:hypothetical protein